MYVRLQYFQNTGTIDIKQVNALFQQHKENDNYFRFFYQIILVAIDLADFSFLESVFELKGIFENRHYLYTEIYFAILTLGHWLRKYPRQQEKLWKIWVGQETARKFYFELFVDIDTLTARHYKAIQLYQEKETGAQAQLFTNCLLFWRALMLKAYEKMDFFIDKINAVEINTSIHPVPIGRKHQCLVVYESI